MIKNNKNKIMRDYCIIRKYLSSYTKLTRYNTTDYFNSSMWFWHTSLWCGTIQGMESIQTLDKNVVVSNIRYNRDIWIKKQWKRVFDDEDGVIQALFRR